MRGHTFAALISTACILAACGGPQAGAVDPTAAAPTREPFARWEAQAISKLAAADGRLAARFGHPATTEEKLAATQDALVLGQPVSLWQGGPDLLSVEYREAVVRRISHMYPRTDTPQETEQYAAWQQLLGEELFRVEREKRLGPAAYGPLRAWVDAFDPPKENLQADPSTNLDARTREENDATLAKRLFLVEDSMLGNESPHGRAILRFALAPIERKLSELAYLKSRAAMAKLYGTFEEADARATPPRPNGTDLMRAVTVFAGTGSASPSGLAQMIPKAKADASAKLAALPMVSRGKAELRAAALLREPCTLQSKTTPPERRFVCAVLSNIAKLPTLSPEEQAATAVAAHDMLILGAMAFEISRDPGILKNLQDRSRFLSQTRYDDIAEVLLATPETCIVSAVFIVRALARANPSEWAERALKMGLPPLSVIDPERPPG